MSIDLVNLKVEDSDSREPESTPISGSTPTPGGSFNRDRLRELSRPEYLDLAIAAQPDLPSKVRSLQNYVTGVFNELSAIPAEEAAAELERVLRGWVPGGLDSAKTDAKQAARAVVNPLAPAKDRMAVLNDHKRSLAAVGLVTLAAGAAFAIPLPDGNGASGPDEGSKDLGELLGSLFNVSRVTEAPSRPRGGVARAVSGTEDAQASPTDLINNISTFIFK